MNVWQKIKSQHPGRPLIVLAPMADVTDIAFRTLISQCGNADMLWTEFVSADGLIRATPEGQKKLMADLRFNETERPITAQLFGSNPEYMEKAAYLVASLGFDAIDINMGCPDKSIEKQGAGSAMIKNPKRAGEIIRATKDGVKRAFDEKLGLANPDIGDFHIDAPIPVSVKTRIGYNKNELDTWLPALLAESPALITIHARTRKELSLVPARWSHVREAVEIRNQAQKDIPESERTLIFGNGDIESVAHGIKLARESGADGAMLGRALFGNPWLFAPLGNNNSGLASEDNQSFDAYIPTVREKLDMAILHTEIFERELGDMKNFAIMKKHFKAYINGFDGAKELRIDLMEKAESASDVRRIIEEFCKTLSQGESLS